MKSTNFFLGLCLVLITIDNCFGLSLKHKKKFGMERALFRLLDRDGDKFLSTDEFFDVANYFDFPADNLPLLQYGTDLNHDDQISYKEFKNSPYMKEASRNLLSLGDIPTKEKMFRVLDTDNNRILTREEFMKFRLFSHIYKKEYLQDAELTLLFDKVDTDHNHLISYEEFEKANFMELLKN